SRRTATPSTTWRETSGNGPRTSSARTAPPRSTTHAARLNGREPRRPTRVWSRAARHRHPAARDQGRLAPVRAKLLPVLSPGGTPERDGRHVDGTHRVPVDRAGASVVHALQSAPPLAEQRYADRKDE